MEINLYRLLLVLLLVGAAGYYFLIWRGTPAETRFQESSIPVALKDRVFHWRYNIGWDFRVKMTEEGVHWEGFAGTFEGMTATVFPHYSQIREDVYFVTWPIPGAGVDSLVLDLRNKKVFGHIKANAKFYVIEGEIYCDSASMECETPTR